MEEIVAKRSGAKPTKRERLIEALNQDLSLEVQAITRYIVYAARVHGPYRPSISALFRTEVADELLHAQALADKVAALGGEPQISLKEIEPAEDARAMLEVVLKAEEQAIAIYRKHLALADSAGDIALRVQYENMIGDETKHAEEMRQILADWL
jgi:bacterioferritin